MVLNSNIGSSAVEFVEAALGFFGAGVEIMSLPFILTFAVLPVCLTIHPVLCAVCHLRSSAKIPCCSVLPTATLALRRRAGWRHSWLEWCNMRRT